jgi:hypothetical protein
MSKPTRLLRLGNGSLAVPVGPGRSTELREEAVGQYLQWTRDLTPRSDMTVLCRTGGKEEHWIYAYQNHTTLRQTS